MQSKIKSLQEIELLLNDHRKKGLRIVQCHGVFDLLHPGHIRHFKQAKSRGDKLVVSITPDRFVNKGPGRPAFNETFRTESIAALEDVDYVILNDTPDATSLIRKIKPSIYVKGMEYKDHETDVTGKITEEVQAVEESGGTIFYTDDVVFSSSSLLNQYFDPPSSEVSAFLSQLKKNHSLDELLSKIEDLSRLKVLVVGDAIIDEYQYTEPLGQSGKGVHMAAKCLQKEVFLGGSLIIASHVAQFTPHVTLLTAIGEQCPYKQFITTSLDSKINTEFVYLKDHTTLTKKRYVLKDGKTLSKLFETYSSNDQLLDGEQTNTLIQYLQKRAKDFDLVIVADFGNGFTNPALIKALSEVPTFLAVNTQTNSGNRGFNVITHYPRADFVSLNEPEIRLAAHDRLGSLKEICDQIAQKLHCSAITVTRGVRGVYCYDSQLEQHIPAISMNAIDRVGAGDTFLALSSLSLAKQNSVILSGFFGSIAAAMSIQMVGNQEAIGKAAFCKFLTRLLK